MYLSQKHISRRTVLRGVGAAVALPLLDAMNPAATVWAATPAGPPPPPPPPPACVWGPPRAASPPKRFAFVGFPHGAIMDRWSPKDTGTSYTMSPILEPLSPFLQHLTIVSSV